MGKKANAEVSFTRASLVHWIQFASSTAQDGEDWKGLKPEEIGLCF